MARKKTVSQHIVHLATPGFPKIAKNIIGSRWGARLTLGMIATLACSGVISVEWENRWPRVSLNRERIAQIQSLAKQTKEQLADKVDAQRAESSAQPVSSEEGKLRGLTKFAANRRDPSATIKIASFNIQVFGTSKAKKANVMQVLADTVRRYDVVAVQELRTTEPAVMRAFVDLINAEGGRYDYVIGPRLGRSNSKEQYVFIFDTNRIEIDRSSLITVQDPKDLLHREPLTARFRTRVGPLEQPFSFILVNIHTDPDETKTELDALGHVYQAVQKNAWGEDDIILLGDLNVSCQKLGLLGTVPDITHTVNGEPTNTRGTKSYDNIVFTRTATSEYTGQSGIHNLQSEHGLTTDQALEVSDHQPVWAEFSMTEAASSTRLASNRRSTDQNSSPPPKIPPPGAATVETARVGAASEGTISVGTAPPAGHYEAPRTAENPSYAPQPEPQQRPSRLAGWLQNRGQSEPAAQPLASEQPASSIDGQPASQSGGIPNAPRRRRIDFRRPRLFNR